MAAFDPDNILCGHAHLTVDGNPVGYTKGGVKLRYECTMLDVEADQVGGTIKKVITGEKMMLSTSLLEATTANLFLALNSPGSGSGDVTFGSAEPDATEHTITLTGPAPDGEVRTYSFYRAVLSDNVDHNVGSRTEVGELPVTFEFLKDPTHESSFGYCADA